MTKQGIIISVLLLIILAGAGFYILKSPKAEIENTTPPEQTERIAAGYVSGHVDIGPICPVEREGMPCKIPPEAYSSREVIVYASDGNSIKEKGKIGAEGNYKIALAPGKYFLQIAPAGIGPGEKKPATVKSFETTVVNFDIDTGIR